MKALDVPSQYAPKLDKAFTHIARLLDSVRPILEELNCQHLELRGETFTLKVVMNPKGKKR